MCSNHNIILTVIMCFTGLEILIFTLEFGNNCVLCQINWVLIPKFLKIIEYLLKTLEYFTQILPLSLALHVLFHLKYSILTHFIPKSNLLTYSFSMRIGRNCAFV